MQPSLYMILTDSYPPYMDNIYSFGKDATNVFLEMYSIFGK